MTRVAAATTTPATNTAAAAAAAAATVYLHVCDVSTSGTDGKGAALHLRPLWRLCRTRPIFRTCPSHRFTSAATSSANTAGLLLYPLQGSSLAPPAPALRLARSDRVSFFTHHAVLPLLGDRRR